MDIDFVDDNEAMGLNPSQLSARGNVDFAAFGQNCPTANGGYTISKESYQEI